MNSEQEWGKPRWHLVHTHPRQELRADFNLKTLNVETYVPMYKHIVRSPFTAQTTHTLKPLFPRYVFVRFRVNDLYHKIKFTRGVQDLVCFDAAPATVDDEVIAMLQSRQDKQGLIRIEDGFQPGDRVVVSHGPFSNLTAVFERAALDSDRVVLLLQTVSYQARVVVDKASIRKPGKLEQAFVQ